MFADYSIEIGQFFWIQWTNRISCFFFLRTSFHVCTLVCVTYNRNLLLQLIEYQVSCAFTLITVAHKESNVTLCHVVGFFFTTLLGFAIHFLCSILITVSPKRCVLHWFLPEAYSRFKRTTIFFVRTLFRKSILILLNVEKRISDKITRSKTNANYEGGTEWVLKAGMPWNFEVIFVCSLLFGIRLTSTYNVLPYFFFYEPVAD